MESNETIDFQPTAVVIRRRWEPEKKQRVPDSLLSLPQNRGVPHTSLVFREMWDTAALHVRLSEVKNKG